MVKELPDSVDSASTDQMEKRLHYILQQKFGHEEKKLEGGNHEHDHKKFDKKSGGGEEKKSVDGHEQKKFELEGGKRRKASKKTSKKASKKTSKKASKKSTLEGGKRRKASKKTSKKTSKKASKKSSLSLEGGKRRKASKKTSKKTSKKASKKTSKKSSKNTVKREVNPYMMARSALIKVMFAKAKSKGIKLTIPDSAKTIKKIEEEVIQKHKLTDKVEILKKALEFFNSNVDKYLKV